MLINRTMHGEVDTQSHFFSLPSKFGLYATIGVIATGKARFWNVVVVGNKDILKISKLSIKVAQKLFSNFFQL